MKIQSKIKNLDKIAHKLARKELERSRARNQRAVQKVARAMELSESVRVNARGWA